MTVNKLVDAYAHDAGAVRDPNGYYMFTPEELWEFTLYMVSDAYVLLKHNPDMTTKDFFAEFKDE